MQPMTNEGWRPISGGRQGAEAFTRSPFTRLARAHAVAVAGDTLVAIALAGTLFFSIDPTEARSKVFLYLALTMAPYAVVAPLVGPALDRAAGGRRWMVIGASALRALVCLMMIDDVDSLLLFPEAFALLVLAKSYHVAKSAMVPSTVHSDEELVEANSKLSLLSGLVGFAAAVPGGIALHFGGSEWVLGLAALVFAAGIGISWGIPKAAVAALPESPEAKEELRSVGVLLAATAMGVLRGVVGFLTFLLAFALRADDSPTWHFGLILAVSAVGSLAGAGVAPILRRQTTENRIISALLAMVAAMGAVAAWTGGLAGAALVAATVGVGAASAKQAFDAIVQRDAPDANRGRSFARFETRFQLFWVAGAVLGIIPMPMWIGFVGVAVVTASAAISYTAGGRGARALYARREGRRPPTAHELGFHEHPGGGLPPTIVTPAGPSAPPPPPRVPRPPAMPPSIATPDHTDVYDRWTGIDPSTDPTVVDRPEQR